MNNISLFNDDCIEIMKLQEDESVDLILTDPPYNLGNFMRNRDTNLKKMRDNFFGDAGWDDLEYDEWVMKMDDFFKESSRILKKRGSIIVFMSLIKIETIITLAQKYGLYYKTTGIWHKTNPMPRNMNLHFINSVEGWIYFVNKARTGTFNNESKAIHDFIETSLTPKSEKQFGLHPTQKPESIIEHFVGILSNPGEIVMDPFMGSGTTGVVSRRMNRSFIGVELDEEYFRISQNRINATDEKSVYQMNIFESEQEL